MVQGRIVSVHASFWLLSCPESLLKPRQRLVKGLAWTLLLWGDLPRCRVESRGLDLIALTQISSELAEPEGLWL